MQDRRKHVRVEDHRRISVALIPEHPEPNQGMVTISAEARDMSRDGIELKTFTAVTGNAFVRVDVPVLAQPRRRMLSLAGIVRWCRLLPGENHYTVGVELFDLREDDRRDWVQQVTTLMS